ncbi:hypothetical protein M9458_054701, partial [Cirrhinus mrigala]
PPYPPTPCLSGDLDFRRPPVLLTSAKSICIAQTPIVPYDTTTDAHLPENLPT